MKRTSKALATALLGAIMFSAVSVGAAPPAHTPVLLFLSGGALEQPGELLPASTLRYRRVATLGEASVGDEPAVVYEYRPMGGSVHGDWRVYMYVVDDERPGAWLADRDGSCTYYPPGDLVLIRDDRGLHPLLVIDEGRVAPNLNTGPRWRAGDVIDWRGVPEKGEHFERTWRSQPHLANTPDSDAVFFRYEGGKRFQPSGRSGRGNSPHHWNLLAYTLLLDEGEGEGEGEGELPELCAGLAEAMP